MRKAWSVSVAVLFATCVSCSGGQSTSTPGCGGPCPTTTVTARLLSGSVTFALNGGATETHALSPDDPPVGLATPSGRCAAGRLMTIVYPPTNGVDSAWGGEVDVECEPTAGSVQVSVKVADRRTLGIGTYPSTPSPQLSFVRDVCASASNSGAASLTITRAEGAPAQYPAAVTTDYVREFNIHIETNSPGETSTNEPGCTTPAIFATVDLQFAESAADAVNDPAAKCGCI